MRYICPLQGTFRSFLPCMGGKHLLRLGTLVPKCLSWTLLPSFSGALVQPETSFSLVAQRNTFYSLLPLSLCFFLHTRFPIPFTSYKLYKVFYGDLLGSKSRDYGLPLLVVPVTPSPEAVLMSPLLCITLVLI